MTRPGIEPRSPRPLVNTISTKVDNIYIKRYVELSKRFQPHSKRRTEIYIFVGANENIWISSSSIIKKKWQCVAQNSSNILFFLVAQSDGVVEYSDCISAERGSPPPTNGSPGYNIKQSHSEYPVKMEFWENRNTPSLPSLPGPI